MPILDRREFIELLSSLSVVSALDPTCAWADDGTAVLSPGTYHPGRIDNEYSLFLPGEKGALQDPPAVSAVGADELTAHCGDQSAPMRIDEQVDGWRLLSIPTINGTRTAVFEKHVTHRGAIVFVTEANGAIASIPKQIGTLSSIRPRQISTPHGVKFDRIRRPERDTVGQYILNSCEDPCYENVAALGPEYVGWTLVANEESGPQHSLYLEASGRSRQLSQDLSLQGLWAPDEAGAVFDPADLIFSSGAGAASKRTLLGGHLPIADIGVWDPTRGAGYEAIVLLPPGRDSKPIARLRATLTEDELAEYNKFKDEFPEFFQGVKFTKELNQNYIERTWNGSAEDFYSAMFSIWTKWHSFHQSGMQVDIPDEWLVDGALAGITLCRSSYTGLDPTYQVGEGGYTKVPPSSHSLFPVAQYEFIWAHQLWGHTKSADEYFQHYLDQYILSDGNFLYNTQDQVEAPLNVGVFLANSARSYFYNRDLSSLEKRLPVLERMIRYVLARYEYSKTTYKASDPHHGLIWGSPEADLGSPHKDFPESHPYFYQNAVWISRGLEEHARCLARAAKDCGKRDLQDAASRYEPLARQVRADVQSSLTVTLARCSQAMKNAGISPFTPEDIDHDPTKLESYENHRFMEDWFLADWGDSKLDEGHWRHRQAANRQILGMATSGESCMTSNFMAHGTLSYLIRQEDYRPFLLTLYALTCYASDCGNRYSPEDAYIPGGHPLEGGAGGWSAVINSTLQTTLGLRWLLCYEENHQEICHLQKAAPKHWFAKGQTIAARNCPTRFGILSWSTKATADRTWDLEIDVPSGFSADLVVHIHPEDGKPLKNSSLGTVRGNSIVLSRDSIQGQAKRWNIVVS